MRRFLEKLPVALRYLIAGGTSTAADLGILYVLTEYAGWWYLASATAAFVVAVVVSFVLQKFYTFQHRNVSRSVVAAQSTLFLTLQLVNVGINTFLMYALVEWAHLWYFFAQIIAAALIAVASFFVYRLIIFNPSEPLKNLMPRVVMRPRRHRAAFVIAILVSLLYGTHHFLMPRFMPEGLVYKPVTYASDHDAGGYYGPRANAFFSRNQLDSPSLLPMANPVIMGGLGKLLGSMERAFVFSDFLFPPLIFLAVYILVCEVLRRRLPALLLSSVFIVSPLAFLLSPSTPTFSTPVLLYFSSFEYPKITFLFYALALLFIFRALMRGGTKNMLLAGIFFGSLFYTYLFDWAYLTVALVVALAWFALRKEWSAVKSCARVLGIGALMSIPYWFNYAVLRRLPQYNDIAFRIGGLEVGRNLRFTSVWKTYARHLVWIAALIATSFKRMPRQAIFLISLLTAYFIVVNVQVVLGFSPQPDHWYRETFLPVMLSFGTVGVWLWDRFAARRVSARRAAYCVFVFLTLFFAHALYEQYRFSRADAQLFGVEQKYADAYAWLNAHTPVGSVVGSISDETNRDIILHTGNSVFLPNGFNELVSNEELWDRARLMSMWSGFTPQEFRSFVYNESTYLFKEYFRSRDFDAFMRAASPAIIPEKELTRYTELFAHTTRTSSVVSPPDYFFVGPREIAIIPPPASFAVLPVVYDAGGVKIYSFSTR